PALEIEYGGVRHTTMVGPSPSSPRRESPAQRRDFVKIRTSSGRRPSVDERQRLVEPHQPQGALDVRRATDEAQSAAVDTRLLARPIDHLDAHGVDEVEPAEIDDGARVVGERPLDLLPEGVYTGRVELAEELDHPLRALVAHRDREGPILNHSP